MHSMSPASPDGSRSLTVPCRHSGCASRQLKQRGWPPWRDLGLGICRGGGKEELVKPPSSAEPWWLRGAPKPHFSHELLRWAGRVPAPATHGQTSCLGATPCPRCTSRPHPPQRVPQAPQARAPFCHHPQPWPCAQPRPRCPGSQTPPRGRGVCLGSFRLLLKFIFLLA